jgi:hypothetical protein
MLTTAVQRADVVQHIVVNSLQCWKETVTSVMLTTAVQHADVVQHIVVTQRKRFREKQSHSLLRFLLCTGDQNSSDLDSMGRFPYLQATLVEKTYCSC